MFRYLQVNNIWKCTPRIQVSIIVLLFLLSTVFGYYEYSTYGTVQGYVGYFPSIFFVPIYEEFIFRGIILGMLVSRVSIKKAIVYSSILFGIWHLKNIGYNGAEQTVRQIVYTGVLIGPIFAYITIRTKSIVPAIILHYGNNLAAAVCLLVL